MILDFLSKIRKKSSTTLDSKVISTNYFKVIEPSEILYDSQIPKFDLCGRRSEKEYMDYIKSVQYLIEEYRNTGKIHSIEYTSFDDIKKYREEQEILDAFRDNFLSIGKSITVEKTCTGQYKVVSNGYHRMYVAKKYGLKLLVRVCQEIVE